MDKMGGDYKLVLAKWVCVCVCVCCVSSLKSCFSYDQKLQVSY